MLNLNANKLRDLKNVIYNIEVYSYEYNNYFVQKLLIILYYSFWEGSSSSLNNAYNDSEQTKCTTKDFDNQDFDKSRWGLGIRKCTTCSCHSYTYTTE